MESVIDDDGPLSFDTPSRQPNKSEMVRKFTAPDEKLELDKDHTATV
jgi:hypothetical protein